jgi:hypothetical protein
MTLYAHAQGDKLGASLPRRLSLRKLGEQTLSTDLVEVVAGRNEVTITVSGPVTDIEGYPPLPEELRGRIQDSEWRLPADLQVSELETRLAERLRTEYDLGDVTVTISGKGEAAVAAAPPFSGLSRRVDSGKRAVSVDALVPTGLARGDIITTQSGETTIRGTVVSARSSPLSADEPDAETDPAEATVEPPGEATAAPTTRGGQGQVTMAVNRSEVATLLGIDSAKVVVASRGTGREYEVVSLLRRSNRRFQRLSVREGGSLDGVATSVTAVRDSHDVLVVAVRTDDTWTFAPRGSLSLSSGDELFVVGAPDALSTFAGVVA